MGARDGPSKEGEMPKERVAGVNPVFIDEESGEENSGEDHPVVEVRWHRWPDSYVSLVTRLRSCEVPPPGEDILASYGFHVELDRDGINEIIRKLRRARDQAYGRDE
jgi:hypothetical protein